MTEHKLSPYDRGTRLEPQLWPLGDDPDSFGRVDFDDDESATVLTAHIERDGDGYTLHLDGLTEPLRVVVDGGSAIELHPGPHERTALEAERDTTH